MVFGFSFRIWVFRSFTSIAAFHIRNLGPVESPNPYTSTPTRSRLSELQETRSAQHPALDAFWGALRRQTADRYPQFEGGQCRARHWIWFLFLEPTETISLVRPW